jgi:hypothetical protein
MGKILAASRTSKGWEKKLSAVKALAACQRPQIPNTSLIICVHAQSQKEFKLIWECDSLKQV